MTKQNMQTKSHISTDLLEQFNELWIFIEYIPFTSSQKDGAENEETLKARFQKLTGEEGLNVRGLAKFSEGASTFPCVQITTVVL